MNNFRDYQREKENGRDRRGFGNNNRDFGGRGRNTSVTFDAKKIKTVNAEALMQSQINNKVVEKMNVATPGGKRLEITGNQLNLFTLTPRKPLIDCPYVQLKVTYEDITKKFGECITRVCTKGETLEMCQMSTWKLESGECIGRKTPITSLGFHIVTNAFVKDVDTGNEGEEFKFVMLNKITNVFTNLTLRDNKDVEKSTSLWNLYNAIKAGTVQTPSIPKPGNLLFYTLFSGEVTVTIETITGEEIKGVVKSYDLPTGHVPSLNVYVEGENGNVLRVVSLYMVSTLIVHRYTIPDVLSRRAFELGTKGHIVIPHKGNNTIYDYCNRHKTDKDQEVRMDGNVIPYDALSKHDIELTKAIRTIK